MIRQSLGMIEMEQAPPLLLDEALGDGDLLPRSLETRLRLPSAICHSAPRIAQFRHFYDQSWKYFPSIMNFSAGLHTLGLQDDRGCTGIGAGP